MRTYVARSAAAFLLILLCSTAARADSVTLVTDDRYVNAWALVFNSSGFSADYSTSTQVKADTLSGSAQAVYADTTSRSQSELVSSISADLRHFTGAGTASSTIAGPSGNTAATSIFSVWFKLDEPLAFDFAGNFEGLGRGSWQTHLVQSPLDLGHQVLRFSYSSNNGPALHARQRGGLDPGLYILTVRTDAFADTYRGIATTSRSRFDFDFDMKPVPEPASLLLVGAGLVGAIARRRARTRACGDL